MKSLVRVLSLGLMSGVVSAGGLFGAQTASADEVGFLVNTFVRPGYNFPNAEAAITYGRSICIRVEAKMGYTELVNQVKSDFRTTDYYQAGYLINQAVEELCPTQIWQLRQSAAGFIPT
ncbi:membrane protein [Mycolicibacterium cyprinidarum]|uniref:Membrane protein n=1 Tax=Mycolicibacterium cyprinidarum TaxID=2860311 RepID=A0ABQ4VA94_9MYCO|nr:membrane protein [Mycolicibacterium sp. NGTWS0302]GJF16328.1 membrane protein [Mycolicibacterium sp. NGTWSNA01]GJF17646.1 membrane protein [Mycolicibacterium sp. NGTWS1803]